MLDKLKAYFRGTVYSQGNARDRPVIYPVGQGSRIYVEPTGNVIFTTCLELLAKYIAQIKWGVFDAALAEAESHNRRFNTVINAIPYPGINAYSFWEQMEKDRLAYGNAYAYIHTENGVLQELIHLDPSAMTMYWDDAGILDAFLQGGRRLIYQYRDPKTSRSYVFLPDEVLHFKAFSANGIQGRRALDVLSDAVHMGAEVESAMRTSVKNGFAGTIILTYTSDLSTSKQKVLQNQIKELLANSDSTILPLPAGMTAGNISNDIRGYYELLDSVSTQKISAIFGIPLAMLNIGGGTGMGTFSTNQMTQFFNATIMPIVSQYASELTAKLLPLKDIQAGYRFDDNNDVFDFLDAQAKASVLCSYTGAGILTANEARKSIKYNPSNDPYADRLTQRGGTGALGDSAENEGGGGTENE